MEGLATGELMLAAIRLSKAAAARLTLCTTPIQTFEGSWGSELGSCSFTGEGSTDRGARQSRELNCCSEVVPAEVERETVSVPRWADATRQVCPRKLFARGTLLALPGLSLPCRSGLSNRFCFPVSNLHRFSQKENIFSVECLSVGHIQILSNCPGNNCVTARGACCRALGALANRNGRAVRQDIAQRGSQQKAVIQYLVVSITLVGDGAGLESRWNGVAVLAAVDEGKNIRTSKYLAEMAEICTT